MRRILATLVLFAGLASCAAPEGQTGEQARQSAATEQAQGERVYADLAAFGDGFLAVGAGGRIDWIRGEEEIQELQSPVTQDLYAVAADEQTALAVGADGSVLEIQADGTVRQRSAGTQAALCDVCRLGDGWLIGDETGGFYQSADEDTWIQTSVHCEGALTGLASNGNRCIAVTNHGEILVADDTMQWSILDYNEYYAPESEVSFSSVEWLNGMFWAYGTQQNGMACLMWSLEGGAWASRELYWTQGGRLVEPEQTAIVGLCSDEEQLYASLDDGSVLTLPSCTDCNERFTTPVHGAIAFQNGLLAVAGEDGGILVREPAQLSVEQPDEALLRLQSISLDEFDRKLQTDEAFFVYVSRPDCGTCQTYDASLVELMEKTGVAQNVYYLNVAELHRDEEAWAAFKQTWSIGGTPSFIHIRAGEWVSSAGWTEQEGLSLEQIETWLREQA